MGLSFLLRQHAYLEGEIYKMHLVLSEIVSHIFWIECLFFIFHPNCNNLILKHGCNVPQNTCTCYV